MKSAVAIRHVAFEGLGVLEGALAEAGYAVRMIDACAEPLAATDAVAPDLLVVLGGPIGAYEDAIYPFLRDELRLLETRLAARRPTLGICLGAQLMARVLGARVYPGPAKEIGWAPVALTADGARSPLAAIGGGPVLHWHGDTFDLPPGATRLASTELTPNQAFSAGRHLLGLQFHAECDGADIERWLVGHACELAAARVDIARLRADSAASGPVAAAHGTRLFGAWLDQLGGAAAGIA